MTETIDRLLEDVVAEKDEDRRARARGIVADYLEENGREVAAAGQRWLAQQYKRPYMPENSKDGSASWFNADRIVPGLGDPESDVPEVLWQKLAGGKEIARHKIWKNRLLAEKSMMVAWEALEAQERQMLLQPATTEVRAP